jgi:hypothetical protein
MISDTMTAWLVTVIPVLIMLFALAMERLENRLRQLALQDNAVQGNEVEEFLQEARPEEVRALFGSGIGRALELFQLRRLPGRDQRRGTRPGNGATPQNRAAAPDFDLVTSPRTRQRP